MSLTLKDLEMLRAPFDEKTIAVKIQSFSRDKTKAMLVCYIQHTDVYDRVERVDPAWSSEVIERIHVGDTVNARVKLTIKGISRENAGEGTDLKSAISDGLKRAAMLFGVGRYLYDSEGAWIPYNEQTDKFKTYTIEDHRRALRQGQAPTPTGPSAQAQAPAPKIPAPTPKPSIRTKAVVGQEVIAQGERMNLSQHEIKTWAEEFAKVPTDKMSLAQLEDFLGHLKFEAGRNGVGHE